MSCGVGHRFNSDPTLLWLWCGPENTAPIGPLAWEPPYTMDAALKRQKNNNNTNNNNSKEAHFPFRAWADSKMYFLEIFDV